MRKAAMQTGAILLIPKHEHRCPNVSLAAIEVLHVQHNAGADQSCQDSSFVMLLHTVQRDIWSEQWLLMRLQNLDMPTVQRRGTSALLLVIKAEASRNSPIASQLLYVLHESASGRPDTLPEKENLL